MTTLGPAPAAASYPVRRVEGGQIETLADCSYFATDKIDLTGQMVLPACEDSFQALLCMEGEGRLIAGDQTLTFGRGDCLFVPATAEKITLDGKALVLCSRV